jgi:hypothetical protein
MEARCKVCNLPDGDKRIADYGGLNSNGFCHPCQKRANELDARLHDDGNIREYDKYEEREFI